MQNLVHNRGKVDDENDIKVLRSTQICTSYDVGCVCLCVCACVCVCVVLIVVIVACFVVVMFVIVILEHVLS